jgi:hypothetical protein
MMGEKVKQVRGDSVAVPASAAGEERTVAIERARKVIPVLAHILGVEVCGDR